MSRILLVNKFWRPAGGVEIHALTVKDALEGLGHEVVPFAMEEKGNWPSPVRDRFPSEVDFRGGGSPRETVRSLARATLATGAKGRLRAVLRAQHFDAAYVLHIYHQLGMPLLNLLRREGVPTILSLHDYKVICPNYRLFSESSGEICTRCFDRPKAALWAPMQERCWSGSRAAGIALSIEALATQVQDSYNQPDLITTLNSLQEEAVRRRGVTVPVLRLPHPVVLGPARPVAERTEFVYIGRLVPEKGVDILITAIAAAGARLRVVGEGRSRAELEQLVSETGADVTFVGLLDQEGVRRELERATALVVPSQWHEVSPLVVYEAFAADVPVVATAVGGMVDQLGEGRGHLIAVDASVEEWAQLLREVSASQAEAQERSAAAREYVATHQSPDQWLAGLREAFQRIGVSV